MIMIAFNVRTGLNKIQHLLLKILKDVYKLVQKEHFRTISFVRNAIKLASNVLLALIIIVLSVQMDSYMIQHTFLRARKNV